MKQAREAVDEFLLVVKLRAHCIEDCVGKLMEIGVLHEIAAGMFDEYLAGVGFAEADDLVVAQPVQVLHQRVSLTPLRKVWIAMRTHWRER